jgi:hypothetical protein
MYNTLLIELDLTTALLWATADGSDMASHELLSKLVVLITYFYSII